MVRPGWGKSLYAADRERAGEQAAAAGPELEPGGWTRETEARAIADPGDDARGLFGARADGRPDNQPALSRLAGRLSAEDGMPGAGEYQFQRARRTDCVHAG